MKDHLKKYIDQGKAPHLRGLRMLVEYSYASDKFHKLIRSKAPVVSVFGSARSKPGSAPYRRAYDVGHQLYDSGYAVVTGASRGVMQAANKGVADAIVDSMKAKYPKKTPDDIRVTREYKTKLKNRSLGLRISLPFEEGENPWVGTAATFHYFMVRKYFFASLSQAFIACEGGWGTRDELFEILTLVQTGKAPVMPIIYLSDDASHLRYDLQHAVSEKFIDANDLKLIDIVKHPAQAVKLIDHFYKRFKKVEYLNKDVIRIHIRNKRPAIQSQLKKIWPRYQGYFQDYRLSSKHLDLIGFSGGSYGKVRELIDKLNRDT